MNPSLKLLLIITISLEISFTSKIITNLLLIFFVLILLILHHCSLRTFIKLLLIPLLPALTIAVTIRWFSPGHSWFFAWVMVSRIYTYCFLGASITISTTPLELARSLEQNAHLPAKYAYGTLAALNTVPRTVQTIQTIRIAAQIRGITLHFWSPQLYFKAILSALSWSDVLAQAMESQGFVEGHSRTHVKVIRITVWDWMIFIISLAIVQVTLLMLP